MPTVKNRRTQDSGATSGERIPAMDGVRGIAILMVVLHNAAFVAAPSDSIAMKLASAGAATGWVGVQLFFVLSGFLITGILLDSVSSPTYFRTFYLRRTLRIFPLYYAVLIVAFLVVPWFGDPAWSEAATRNQWRFWTYTSNWSDAFGHGIEGMQHFWSLAVEEQFYLVWPVVLLYLGRRKLAVLCVALIALSPLIRHGLLVAGTPSLGVSTFTVARLDALATGALVAALLRSDVGRAWLSRWMAPLGYAAIAFLLGFLALTHGFHEGDPQVQTIGQTPINVVAAFLICICLESVRPNAERARRFLSSRWLRTLGKYSYAMYVFHWPIHLLVARRVGDLVNTGGGAERLGRLLVYTAVIGVLSLLAAMISWRVLESPFLRLKDFLAPRRTESPQLAATA